MVYHNCEKVAGFVVAEDYLLVDSFVGFDFLKAQFGVDFELAVA